MRFDQQAIYITGAGHGIGRATALRLAAEGGSVAVSDIDGAAFNLISPGTIRTRNWTVRDDDGGKRARKYRSAASASRRTSLPPWPSSRPTTRHGSPASTCRSKAAS